MKKKVELAYSRALVPIKGKFYKKIVMCILIIAIIAIIIFIK